MHHIKRFTYRSVAELLHLFFDVFKFILKRCDKAGILTKRVKQFDLSINMQTTINDTEMIGVKWVLSKKQNTSYFFARAQQ